MARPQLRPARADEAAALLELWHRAGSVPTATDDLGSIEAVLAASQADVIVAEADGAVVGSIIATWDGWRGHLYRLAVDPLYRRSGLASALVAAGERLLSGRGAVRILAIVMADDERAASFWSSAGYQPQPDVDRYAKTVGDRR